MEEGLARSSNKQHSENTDKRYLCKASSFSNSEWKSLWRRVLIEEGLAKSSKKQHFKNADKWVPCKTGSFSYSESLRTPPLEGTSFHRWNNSVEKPLGILSLLTTCLRLWVKSHCHLLPHLQNMPPKISLQNMPQNAVEKRVLQNVEEKKLVLGFLHSVNHTGSPQDESYIHNYFIGWFSQAGLLEWMCFVIFHARSCERSQHTSGPISE